MRILICDDHAIVRRGLVDVISEQMPGCVIGQASCDAEVMPLLERERWDALILDIGLPQRNGLDILRDVKARWPGLPVLLLTVYGEEQYSARARQFGASGFLTKDAAPDEIIRAIGLISRGATYFLATNTAVPTSLAVAPLPEAPRIPLSEREDQVLKMLSTGLTPGEIAAKLDLSIKTVSTYRTRVLHKLGLSRTGELSAYGIRRGLAG